MSYNNKQTTKSIASLGAKVMNRKSSSQIAKSLGASAVSQYNTEKQTGKAMETKASNVMKSNKYSRQTKKLAASILSQANKQR